MTDTAGSFDTAQLNPLNNPGEIFELSLLNPNPTSSKTKDGPVYRVSFELERDEWQMFMDAETKGMMLAAHACVVKDGGELEAAASKRETVAGAKPYGHEAKELKLSGFFRSPDVWRAIGTDDEYRAWINRQRSAYSNKFSEYVDGDGRSIAAHVRRADESGIAYKAEYACIPLTQDEHNRQHQNGEGILAAKEWFDEQRIKYVEKWAWDTLKARLGHDSMADVMPSKLLAWAQHHEVMRFLPEVYRNA